MELAAASTPLLCHPSPPPSFHFTLFLFQPSSLPLLFFTSFQFLSLPDCSVSKDEGLPCCRCNRLTMRPMAPLMMTSDSLCVAHSDATTRRRHAPFFFVRFKSDVFQTESASGHGGGSTSVCLLPSSLRDGCNISTTCLSDVCVFAAFRCESAGSVRHVHHGGLQRIPEERLR